VPANLPLDQDAATGIFAAPEGGACLAALIELHATGFARASDRVVLVNTGTGLKYSYLF
jgi:threonine synthase